MDKSGLPIVCLIMSVVTPTRFELVTPGLGIRCSIQLSYGTTRRNLDKAD
jgi:hypothetical protein